MATKVDVPNPCEDDTFDPLYYDRLTLKGYLDNVHDSKLLGHAKKHIPIDPTDPKEKKVLVKNFWKVFSHVAECEQDDPHAAMLEELKLQYDEFPDLDAEDKTILLAAFVAWENSMLDYYYLTTMKAFSAARRQRRETGVIPYKTTAPETMDQIALILSQEYNAGCPNDLSTYIALDKITELVFFADCDFRKAKKAKMSDNDK